MRVITLVIIQPAVYCSCESTRDNENTVIVWSHQYNEQLRAMVDPLNCSSFIRKVKYITHELKYRTFENPKVYALFIVSSVGYIYTFVYCLRLITILDQITLSVRVRKSLAQFDIGVDE